MQSGCVSLHTPTGCKRAAEGGGTGITSQGVNDAQGRVLGAHLSKAALCAPVPLPGGRGQLMVKPSPSPTPCSHAALLHRAADRGEEFEGRLISAGGCKAWAE